MKTSAMIKNRIFELTTDQIEEFGRDGVTCIRNAFTSDEVDQLRCEIETCVERDRNDAGKTAIDQSIVNGFCLWMKSEYLASIARNSALPSLAAQLLSSKKINLYCDHLFVKEPGTPERPTPWHCDLPYWTLRGTQVLSFWIALDSVELVSGGLRFVRGSHRWDFSDVDGDVFTPTPGIEENSHLHSFAHYGLAPGDMTVHHALTVHGAAGNSTVATRRRGYIIRYAGDDVRYEPRSVFTVPGASGMCSGQILDSNSFPVVFQAQRRI